MLLQSTSTPKDVQRPTPVLVAALNDDFDSFTDAAVGLDSRIAQIIEPAQDVVVPKRGERKSQPALVEDFAGSISRARFSSAGSRQVFRRAW